MEKFTKKITKHLLSRFCSNVAAYFKVGFLYTFEERVGDATPKSMPMTVLAGNLKTQRFFICLLSVTFSFPIPLCRHKQNGKKWRPYPPDIIQAVI